MAIFCKKKETFKNSVSTVHYSINWLKGQWRLCPAGPTTTKKGNRRPMRKRRSDIDWRFLLVSDPTSRITHITEHNTTVWELRHRGTLPSCASSRPFLFPYTSEKENGRGGSSLQLATVGRIRSSLTVDIRWLLLHHHHRFPSCQSFLIFSLLALLIIVQHQILSRQSR